MDATEVGQGYEGEMGEAEQEMDTGEGDVPAEDEPYQNEAEYDMESDDQGENEQMSGKENSENSKQVFVGGLVHTTTADDLKEYFSAFGTVLDSVVAHDKAAAAKGKSRRSKGFGFVTMTTADEAIAILNETHQLHGRAIVVEPSKPKDASEIKLRLSLTGLDKEKTTKESLREHFSQFGEVSECILRMSKVEGKMMSRGYGVIKMATEEGTNAVMAANNEKGRQIIDGASVVVKADKIKLKRYQLYVGNLDPDETTTADILECFSKYGFILEVVFSQKVSESEGVRSTHAFLRMSTDDQHEAILNAQLGEDPHKIHGRVLDIKKDHEKLRRFYVDDIDKDKTVEADLEEYFGAFGVVQECFVFRERSIDGNELGESKGYAMMLMSTVTETDAILKRKEPHILHEKTLTLGRTVSVPPVKEHPTKMTVTCLKDTNIIEKDLREYFGPECTIKSVQFPLNMATGEKIGFALMELDSHHDVEKFAMLRDHVIKGHKVIVNKVKKKKADNLQNLIDRGKERGRAANRGGYGHQGREDWPPNWDYGPPQRWGARPPLWAPRPPFRGGGPARWGGGPPPRGRAPPPWGRGLGLRGRGRGFGPHDGWGGRGCDGPRFRGRGRGGGGPAGGGPGARGWGGFGNEWNNRLSSPKMIRRGWGHHRGRPY